ALSVLNSGDVRSRSCRQRSKKLDQGLRSGLVLANAALDAEIFDQTGEGFGLELFDHGVGLLVAQLDGLLLPPALTLVSAEGDGGRDIRERVRRPTGCDGGSPIEGAAPLRLCEMTCLREPAGQCPGKGFL